MFDTRVPGPQGPFCHFIPNASSPASRAVPASAEDNGPGPTQPKPTPAEPGEAENLLSLREIEVLGALATGCRYKEVAAKLGVSHNTIRSHVRRIYEKLHAHGVMEAARKARDAGVRLQG